MEKPRWPVGAFVPSEILLALCALSMHLAGLEAALFQPAHDLVLREATFDSIRALGTSPRWILIGVTESEMLAS
jgi:hypothetical protein